uniref:Uncharacterized protein n=1 Tax=Anguilla anguilla TaxID=7936 RepID=A0A0E9WSN9_ANGAN
MYDTGARFLLPLYYIVKFITMTFCLVSIMKTISLICCFANWLLLGLGQACLATTGYASYLHLAHLWFLMGAYISLVLFLTKFALNFYCSVFSFKKSRWELTFSLQNICEIAESNWALCELRPHVHFLFFLYMEFRYSALSIFLLFLHVYYFVVN